jgi:stage II sporulation protein D
MPIVLVRLTLSEPLALRVTGAFTLHRREPRGERGPHIATGNDLVGTLTGLGAARRVGSLAFGAGWVELVPASDGTIMVGERGYRGTLLFGEQDDKPLLLNRLPIEDYLMGVLGGEMPLSWHPQALRAQAVAARSYALYELTHRSRQRVFDVHDTVSSQVYRGMEVEDPRAREAIHSTRGLILTWREAPLKAFFHSTCGGHTVAADEAFASHRAVPLGGRPCSHCSDSPVFAWERRFDLATVSTLLAKAAAQPVGRLRSARVERSGQRAGRALFDTGEQRVAVDVAHLRQLLGTGLEGLLSTRYELQVTADELVVTGHGWGHGVGLCQYGAQGMARRGTPAEQILAYYYPGAVLARLW